MVVKGGGGTGEHLETKRDAEILKNKNIELKVESEARGIRLATTSRTYRRATLSSDAQTAAMSHPEPFGSIADACASRSIVSISRWAREHH